MKNAILIIVSIIIVWFAWTLLRGLFAGLLGILFQLAILAAFCYAVYLVYKALNREKIF